MHTICHGVKGLWLSSALCTSLFVGVSAQSNSSTVTLTTSSSTTFLPPAECRVGFLSCPFPEGMDYTVLGSEGVGAPCSAQDGTASNFVSFAIGQCNATVVNGTGKETYHATLVPVASGPIEFLDEGSFVHCSCEVITSADAAANISDLANPLEEAKVSGSNDFEPVLRVFGDSSFTTPLVSWKAAPATKSFYLEVSSNSTGDHIGVEECVTAPSSDFPDGLTLTLVNNTSCDAGDFGIRRLENPSKHIFRIETRAFKFRTSSSVHIRCTVLRCAVDALTCAPCGTERRLSASSSGGTVGIVVASFGAPASTGDGSVLVLGGTEDFLAADTQGDEQTQEVSAGHTLAGAFPTLLFLAVGTAVLAMVA